MLDTVYEKFIGTKFTSIVFCGGDVCGGGGRHGVRVNISN